VQQKIDSKLASTLSIKFCYFA